MDKTVLENDTIVFPQFYDIDPMNVVWHGNYLRFMDQARSELMLLIDYNYDVMQKDNLIWPIVKVDVKYIKPLFLQQKIRIHAKLIEYEHRLVISYHFYDEHSTVLCKAKTTQMAVRIDTKESVFNGSQLLKKKLEHYLT